MKGLPCRLLVGWRTCEVIGLFGVSWREPFISILKRLDGLPALVELRSEAVDIPNQLVRRAFL